MGKPFILIVEDNRIQQRVVELFSVKSGYNYQTVSCWSELSDLLTTIRLTDVDLILMDWHLRTATTGLECTRYIRRMEAGTRQRVPIIGMTANAMEGDRDECIQAGMDDVLTKPFMYRQFKATIDGWLESSESPDRKIS